MVFSPQFVVHRNFRDSNKSLEACPNPSLAHCGPGVNTDSCRKSLKVSTRTRRKFQNRVALCGSSSSLQALVVVLGWPFLSPGDVASPEPTEACLDDRKQTSPVFPPTCTFKPGLRVPQGCRWKIWNWPTSSRISSRVDADYVIARQPLTSAIKGKPILFKAIYLTLHCFVSPVGLSPGKGGEGAFFYLFSLFTALPQN